MKSFFEKREVLFAVMWIVIYVVGMSTVESLTDSVFIAKCAASALGAVMSVVLLVFISKAGLAEYLGLCRPKLPAKRMLFYIPLVAVGSVNLWYGVTMKMTVAESAAYVVSMIFVGFLEELIFRGLLFRAMCKSSVKAAFIVTSLTFGAGHIVNLINGTGQSVLETGLQIIYAVAIGFVFAAVAYFSRSILPCILTHIAVNTLSTFAAEHSDTIQMITAGALSVISFAYAGFIIVRERGKAAQSA